MGLFRRGQADNAPLALKLEHLERELSKVQSTVRQLEVEQVTLHDQVRKWMRRAVAAERVVERARGAAPDAPPTAAPSAARQPWGARARRMLRRQAEHSNGALPGPAEVDVQDTTDEGEA